MGVLSFIALLFVAMFGVSLLGAILEILAIPLAQAIPRDKREELDGVAFVYASAGRPMDRFAVAKVAPGIGHLIAGYGLLKDLVVFASLGLANGVLVTRFLENPDRADWLWYVVAALNATPAMPNHKMRAIPIWLRLVTLITYICTAIFLR